MEKSVPRSGGKALNIPVCKLVLLCDNPECQSKIQDNYKNKLLVMDLEHLNPNVCTIKSLNGKGHMCTVKQWQLFDLQKSQGDNLLGQAPNTTLHISPVKKPPNRKPPWSSHLYGARSKTKVNSIYVDSSSEA